MPAIQPYGAWKSPITSDLIVAGTIGLSEPAIDGDDIYWLEARPEEQGRVVLVRWRAGQSEAINPPPFNMRTRVHEYGGGSYLAADGVVYGANFSDQRWHRFASGQAPEPTTPERDLRYADCALDRARGLIFAVREDHTGKGEAVNTIVALRGAGDLDSGGRVIASGFDFFASPRLSADGQRLCWLAWNHPNMPWDGCALWVAELDAHGAPRNARVIAGGTTESIAQPEWAPDGCLMFVSDRSNWWNLYRWDGVSIEALWPIEAEFALPAWVFGHSRYAVLTAGRVLCAYSERGQGRLAVLDTKTRAIEQIATPYSDISGLHASGAIAVFVGAGPDIAPELARLDLASGRIDVLKRSSDLAIDRAYLSPPRAIEFPTAGGKTSHGFFYPPHNPDFMAPAGERAPLIVISHGGPTSATSPRLDLRIQYWTSRGFGVLDVNYGGSTGYGRAYRERLKDNWGIVDVDDCVNGAKYLAARGEADGERLIIRGGSAGGYTTLAALAFRDVFKAGASYYGISDLEALAKDTHKFESRYLDGLVGPYPARRDLYLERSPIHFVDRLNCKLILFQGLEDRVVPPNQSQMMFDAVRKKGLPVAYIAYEGEQHGFRQAKNIKHALDAELYFYTRVFAIRRDDLGRPITIENLD
jgi:dipeptidyl aminopeptidase/acylaminoacyl peptidase